MEKMNIYTKNKLRQQQHITLAYPTIEYYICHTDKYYLSIPPPFPALFSCDRKCPMIHQSLSSSTNTSVFCHIMK